eukprot:GHVS01038508.1.p1 GENE.GHVS01038508.1~~GHVS01038508.1.p1  ORF type:complete len:104 (+),score=15.23 GHVS01038508.1:34-345(+)
MRECVELAHKPPSCEPYTTRVKRNVENGRKQVEKIQNVAKKNTLDTDSEVNNLQTAEPLVEVDITESTPSTATACRRYPPPPPPVATLLLKFLCKLSRVYAHH